MKSSILLTVTLAVLATGSPGEANAGSRERAFIAGLIGGAAVTHALNDSNPRIQASYSYRPYSRSSCYTTTAVRGTYVNSARSNSYLTERVVERDGYYKLKRERVWVPGYREKVRLSCGRWVIREVPGRYDFQTRRVWVPESRVVVARPSRTRIVYVR